MNTVPIEATASLLRLGARKGNGQTVVRNLNARNVSGRSVLARFKAFNEIVRAVLDAAHVFRIRHERKGILDVIAVQFRSVLKSEVLP